MVSEVFNDVRVFGIDLNHEIFQQFKNITIEAFVRFHNQNPHIYEEFKKLAFQMKLSGQNKYSAYALFHVIRWNEDIKTSGKHFKISNNNIPIYSRILCHFHPEFNNFFLMKKSYTKDNYESLMDN